MDKPLVSVIIPVYNAELYLERCIDSVLEQDYDNIEIVLVNDGSTDKSGLICQNYADKYPREILVVSQHNQGASIARKTGISASHGEFLMFIDSDDFVSNLYVSSLYSAMLNSGSDLAICPVKRIEVGESPQFPKNTKSRTLYREELFNWFFKYEFWGFPGGIYQKDLFNKVHFPIATVNEDYYVKAQIFAAVDHLGYVEESLYCYEQHPGSLSKQKLSLRALGEFDNALATWEFVRTNCHSYSYQSLSIVSEVVSKWLSELVKVKEPCFDYRNYNHRMKSFLKSNLFTILVNPHLLWKIKLILILNLLR